MARARGGDEEALVHRRGGRETFDEFLPDLVVLLTNQWTDRRIDARPARAERIGAGRILARPWWLGDDHSRRMNLIAGDELRGRDAERARHARPVLPYIFGHVVRADPAIEALIDALRHAARAGEEGVAD